MTQWFTSVSTRRSVDSSLEILQSRNSLTYRMIEACKQRLPFMDQIEVCMPFSALLMDYFVANGLGELEKKNFSTFRTASSYFLKYLPTRTLQIG